MRTEYRRYSLGGWIAVENWKKKRGKKNDCKPDPDEV